MYTRRFGFSLMEMLMVLLVIALITLSFFTLKQRNMEVDKAEDLGYRLFEYGQALGDFLRTEGKEYDATEPGVLNFDGYAWLQEKGYLNNEFTLVVEPLYVENIPGKSTPLHTTILIKDMPGRPGEYELMLDLVEIGPVYSRNDVRTDENGNQITFQDASLIARAVNYANEYRDNLKGSGVIQYRRVEIGTEPPAEPPPPGTEPPPAAPFTGLSIIQGTTVDQSLWNDAWLLRSGHNTMQGQIVFETPLAEDSAINNVNRIKFRTEGLAAITDLQTLNFAHGGMINNVQGIQFITSQGSVSSMDGLDVIRFKTDASVQTSIENLSKIQFKNNRVFQGFGYLGTTRYNGNDGADYKSYQIAINSQPVPFINNYCYVSGFHRQGNDNEQKDFECHIERNATTNTFHLNTRIAKTSWCEVSCYNFAP